jgi:hypothetical protein
VPKGISSISCVSGHGTASTRSSSRPTRQLGSRFLSDCKTQTAERFPGRASIVFGIPCPPAMHVSDRWSIRRSHDMRPANE